MYTILYWTFHVHGFVHDFMRVLWYCVILHDVTFALKALYFNGNDIVWHAMIKKLLVPVSPLNQKRRTSQKPSKSHSKHRISADYGAFLFLRPNKVKA